MDTGNHTNMDQKTPPKRTDTVGEGHSIAEATAEAHDREGRNEAATDRENLKPQVAALPPDNGAGGLQAERRICQ